MKDSILKRGALITLQREGLLARYLALRSKRHRELTTMSKKAKQVHVIGELELIKRSHSDPDAAKALRQVQDINAKGGLPEIRYSEFNGYSVSDKRGPL